MSFGTKRKERHSRYSTSKCQKKNVSSDFSKDLQHFCKIYPFLKMRNIYIYTYLNNWNIFTDIYSIYIYIYVFFLMATKNSRWGQCSANSVFAKQTPQDWTAKSGPIHHMKAWVMTMADRRKSLSILTSSSTGYMCMDIIHTHMYIHTYIIIYMGVNYNISLTWIKAIKGDDFPLKTMIPGFRRSEVVISYPSSFRPRGRAAAHLPWYHLPQSRWPWQWPAAAHNRRR